MTGVASPVGIVDDVGCSSASSAGRHLSNDKLRKASGGESFNATHNTTQHTHLRQPTHNRVCKYMAHKVLALELSSHGAMPHRDGEKRRRDDDTEVGEMVGIDSGWWVVHAMVRFDNTGKYTLSDIHSSARKKHARRQFGCLIRRTA